MTEPATRPATLQHPSDKNPRRTVEIAGGGIYPIALEGFPFLACGIGIAAGLATFGHPTWAVLPALFSAFTIWFFRNPKRTTPLIDRAVISPADGRICLITDLPDVPALGGPARRVSIFMSPLNVHVNRAPISGTVIATTYTPGRFINASLDKASEHNERNAILMQSDDGKSRILFVQIAGFIARRIVCYARPGDTLNAGQRFGLIRFGSRVDVYLPPNTPLEVKLDEHVSSGETILARLTA